MIEVKEVLSRKQKKEFLDFPLELYKGHPCFVPPLYMDEKAIFKKNYLYYDTSEAVYYNAYKDGVMAGRISGILQHSSNDKWGQKRIRFTRFDVIEDFEVAKALFDAVEAWGRSKGMEEICGPLGFSDLEREGLLIDGFDQPNTFEEQYNYPYYADFIDRLGYAKDVDWVESQLRLHPDAKMRSDMKRMADIIMKRYKLRIAPAKNVGDFLNRYSKQLFELLDLSYEKIYGTVPFTEGMKKLVISNFRMIVDLKYAAVIINEEGKALCFGIAIPSIAKAVQKSGGHLTPGAIYRILKSKFHPETLELALIGVDPDYINQGIPILFANALSEMLEAGVIKYADTNLNLEDNLPIQNLWKRFDRTINKKRRSYVKKLV